jgi:hypothetical protein
MEFTAKGVFHRLSGIDGHVALVHKIVRADVIKASNVVFVLVGENHRIEVRHLLAEHLLAKIRACINGRCMASGSHDCGGPEPLITGVGRCANRACAADDRNALRRSSAGEGEFNTHGTKVRLGAGNFGLKARTFIADYGC